MKPAIFDTVGDLTARTGQQVYRTVGSTVAGVSSVLPGYYDSPLTRPDVKDPGSEAAYEVFKEYNIESNVRAGERKMWFDIVDKIVTVILFGASAGLGTALAGWMAGTTIGAPLGLTAIFVGALAVTVGAYYMLNRAATRDLTGQTMDVKDFQLRREASFVAKALKQALDKEGLEADINKKQPVDVAKIEEKPPVQQLSSIVLDGKQALQPDLERLH